MIMYVLEFAAKMPQQCFNKPAQRLRFGYRMTFHGIFTPLSQYRKSPVLYLRRQGVKSEYFTTGTKHVRALVMSDIHLGSKWSKAGRPTAS